MDTISSKITVAETAIIHDGAIIEDGVVIHDYVVIYPNTIIKKNVEIYDHCVLGKPPTSAGSLSRKLKESYPPLIIGENSVLCPSVSLYTGTKIGRNTLLCDMCFVREECEIGDFCIISTKVGINYNTKIGNRVKIMANSHITGNAIIEDDVFISVMVSSANDNMIGKDEYSEKRVIGPHIREGARIGVAAVLLPGVVIGAGSIVGAGSVVTRDIPDNELWFGSPARYVKDIK